MIFVFQVFCFFLDLIWFRITSITGSGSLISRLKVPFLTSQFILESPCNCDRRNLTNIRWKILLSNSIFTFSWKLFIESLVPFFQITALLNYDWNTINHTYLKCITWQILTYVNTHENISTSKVMTISITPKRLLVFLPSPSFPFPPSSLCRQPLMHAIFRHQILSNFSIISILF